MAETRPGKPKGVLHPDEAARQFQLSRLTPSEDLQFFIENFWTVAWDLGDEVYKQDVLAYPSVHLVFERGNTLIWGVVTGKFSRLLEGRGNVFGIKFRPGGFYPFWKVPVFSFSDDTIELNKVFDVKTPELEEKILSLDDKQEMVKQAEDFLRRHLPEKDGFVEQVNKIIDAVIADNTLIKVDQITEKFDMSKRSLQRLFKRYIGVSPKWIIKRYRLHEAAGVLAENNEVDWTELALDLGYFDQAHFINDFKSIVGQTPAEYAHRIHS